MTLLDRLMQKFPTAKRQTLKRMVQDGRVRINGVVADALKRPVGAEDAVEILPARKAKPVSPFPIIFEDEDILVVNKPAGFLTSTVRGERRPTVLAALREYVGGLDRAARVGLVHRLDRDASGLLVFSKNIRAYQSLKRQFFEHTAARVYLAIVSPVPREAGGRIESTLVEHADGTVHSTREGGRGQRAITDFVVAKCRGDTAVVRVTLQTGRKHQIRVHFAEKGCPIVGDVVYGGKSDPGGLMLAAVELEIEHPRTRRRQSFKIVVPGHLGRMMAGMEAENPPGNIGRGGKRV